MLATLPAPDKIEPAAAWAPWKPSPADPWNARWAAHLYRRASFGASHEEIRQAVERGCEGTLDRLFGGESSAGEMLPTLLDIGRVAAQRDDGTGMELRSWWLYCMLQGGHPLREKMTLFWHNHFATSIAKVRNPALMFAQNCLLREHAFGRFEPTLQALSRDGAMLVWLDSNSNVKGKPNENYARELMELFSLGVGNYTERDVREAARAFTGWHTHDAGFQFNADAHDNGLKKILGQTGKWDGGDVIRIILEQPAAARFLVRKLYAFFVSEIAPPDSLLEPLCESLRRSNYDVSAVLRTMLSSRLFFSDHAFRKRIKSPVEYVLGTVRAICKSYDEGDANYRPLPHRVLVRPLTGMGQTLFAPPNVKGWSGGRVWLNTSTVLERNNFAAALASGRLWWDERTPFRPAESLPPPRAFDPARILEEVPARSARDIVTALGDRLAPGGMRGESIERLADFLAEGKPAGKDLAERVREAVHGILTMPEYQLA
jgi:hypothetical protein